MNVNAVHHPPCPLLHTSIKNARLHNQFSSGTAVKHQHRHQHPHPRFVRPPQNSTGLTVPRCWTRKTHVTPKDGRGDSCPGVQVSRWPEPDSRTRHFLAALSFSSLTWPHSCGARMATAHFTFFTTTDARITLDIRGFICRDRCTVPSHNANVFAGTMVRIPLPNTAS